MTDDQTPDNQPDRQDTGRRADPLAAVIGTVTAPPVRPAARADALASAMAAFDAGVAAADAEIVDNKTQETSATRRRNLRHQQQGLVPRITQWIGDFTMEHKRELLLATAASFSLVLVGVTLHNQTALGPTPTASLTGAPEIESIPGDLSSPFYESLLSTFNEDAARRALEESRDFVPVLQGRPQIATDLTLPLPPAPVPQTADQDKLTQARQQPVPGSQEQVSAAAAPAGDEMVQNSAPGVQAMGDQLVQSPLGRVVTLFNQPEAESGMVKPQTLVAPASPPISPPRDVVPPQPLEEIGRDRFDDIPINPLRLTQEAPVSTFSVDVDTASYSFVRGQLNRGVLPQPNAVRIEEMVNYFDYAYPVPEDRAQPFAPSVAVYPTPWNNNTHIMHVGIKGYELADAQRPRANLTFLLDTSGSMTSADKLPLLQQSMRMLVEELEPDDTIAIVAYAGAAGVVLEPTPVVERRKILNAINNMTPGGSTAGGAGIKLAYDLAAQSFDEGAVNRVILGTDGDFNVGITDTEELKGFIERQRDSGVFLSVLGFGAGNYNDSLMQALAQNGNGTAAYIDTVQEARKVLVEEAGSTLFPIAKDVKIQVEFNPNQITEYRLIGYESRMLAREDFNNDRVDAGDIGSGHTVTALYEVVLADNVAGRRVDPLRYAMPAADNAEAATPMNDELAYLKLRYKLPDEDTSQLITRPVTQSDIRSMDALSDDIRFAGAVAGFAQLLRNPQYLDPTFGYEAVIELANGAKGADEFGERAEFVQLVRQAVIADTMR